MKMGEVSASMANGVNPVNGSSAPETTTPLQVVIVGAGIGGLTVAIALRQQGHEVTVLEQSRFASEAGAAIHLAPNANGLLRRLGIFAENFGANLMQNLSEYTHDGKQMRSMDLEGPGQIWQHPWLLAHRVSLHDNLKIAATHSEGKGKAVQLNTSTKVVDVDTETATVTTEDGKKFHADLVLGADGVHSITRGKLPGGDVKPFGSGKSAFRFLIERKAAQEDARTSRFVQKPGDLCIWYGSDRRIVMYPTSNNKLLNFVNIHPESESESDASGDWNTTGNLEKMLQIYKSFDSDVLALLEKADPSTLKVWKLLDMPVIPTWINGRLALLGDAAHPFLPHQGQGGGCAIEDAISIAAILPSGTKAEDIPDRLKLYESIRYERANKIQEYSRQAGRDPGEKDGAKMDMYAYTNYNFGHDEWDNSVQKLREWTWARTPQIYWRMPIAFGPMPGPRQNTLGVVRKADHSTFMTASVKFKTSRTVLQNLFPPGRLGYSFKSPGTVAYASFSQTTLNKMEWLGGSGYRHIGLYIHGVQYTKKNGEVINGTYMPLLFESLTDPIVSGREELGMPKLLSTVDVHRRANSYRINTGWEGAIWGQFAWEGLEEVDTATQSGKISGEDDDGILVYRYIPAVGRENKGKADAEYPVFVPFKEDFPQPRVQRVYQAKKASFKIDPLDWEALPTLHHIISRLHEIPVYEIVGGKVVEGEGVPDVGAAHRIE